MVADKKVSISIIGKTDQFVKSLTKSQKALKKLGSVAAGIGKAAALGIAGIGAVAATVGKDMVNLASDAGEAEAAFQATFGEAVPEFGTFIEDFSKKAGLASFELKDLMKTSGMVLQGIDMTAQESAQLSQALATVAGDVAAFNNVQGGTQPVMEAFTKALLGERESLKTYGIAISEAEVQTKAFEMTGKSSKDELTKMEKAQATYQLLVAKSAVTQGYLNAEQDTFATKSKQAAAQVKELQAELGNELLPIVTDLLPVIIDLVKEVGPSLSSAIKAVAPFIEVLANLFTQLAPPIIAIISLLLTALAPAFRKMTEFVEKYMAPFLTNLPQNFEKMVNKIIGTLNKFINKINSFASKAQNLLSKIGIDIDMPQLKNIEEIVVNLGKEVEAKLSLGEIDAAREEAGVMASIATNTKTSGQNLTEAITTGSGLGGALTANAGTSVTQNFYGAVTNPQELGDIIMQGIPQANKQNGTIDRVISGGGGAGLKFV